MNGLKNDGLENGLAGKWIGLKKEKQKND